MKRSMLWVCLAAFAAAASACSDSPSQPSSNSSLTASVSAPKPVSPGDTATVKNSDQPASLVVSNAASTQQGVMYTFEVASDSGFASKVQTKDNVPAGSGGQTVVKLDNLAPGHDYYWHARITSGGTTGLFGPTSRFTIGPAVAIDPPVPVGPLSGTTSAGWPAFTVVDSTRSGPVGSVVYRFEIATNASFNPLLLSGIVNEQPNRTTFTPPASQAPTAQTTLFWRATAIDQTNNVSSPVSAAQSFVYAQPSPQAQLAAQAGYVLWPGTQPPGTTGHAVLGANWEVAQVVSFNGVPHTKPTLEELRVFDLIDRGMNPFDALNWMNANGYSTEAVYYPSVQVIGFPFEYMALVGGQWELVMRVGA